VESVLRLKKKSKVRKGRLQWEGFAEKEDFKPGMTLA